MIFKATVNLYIEASSQAEACDGIAETLRDHMRTHAPQSCLLDWGYSGGNGVYAEPTEMSAEEIATAQAESIDWPETAT